MFGRRKNKWKETANNLIDFCCGELGSQKTIEFLYKECGISKGELKRMGFDKAMVDYIIFNYC